MPEDIQLEELNRRLRAGDYLEISTGGGRYEVWAEPFGSPPQIFYEGEPSPIEETADIAAKIIERIRTGEIRARWVDKRDD